MHAMYHFLINVGSDETIAGAQYGQFGAYVEDKFDENNWFTPLSLTIKGGKTEISDDNYRGGFDAWVGEDERDAWDFDAATDAAYKAMYYEINRDLNLLTEEEHGFDREFQSIDSAAMAIAEALAGSYTSVVTGHEDSKWSYVRPRLAKTYEQLRDPYFEAPFFNAYDFTPYNARNFDLTGGDDDGLAILTVDVHT